MNILIIGFVVSSNKKKKAKIEKEVSVIQVENENHNDNDGRIIEEMVDDEESIDSLYVRKGEIGAKTCTTSGERVEGNLNEVEGYQKQAVTLAKERTSAGSTKTGKDHNNDTLVKTQQSEGCDANMNTLRDGT
eukprot:80915_1